MVRGAVANKNDETDHTLEKDNKISLTFGGNYLLPWESDSAAHFDLSSF